MELFFQATTAVADAGFPAGHPEHQERIALALMDVAIQHDLLKEWHPFSGRAALFGGRELQEYELYVLRFFITQTNLLSDSPPAHATSAASSLLEHRHVLITAPLLSDPDNLNHLLTHEEDHYLWFLAKDQNKLEIEFLERLAQEIWELLERTSATVLHESPQRFPHAAGFVEKLFEQRNGYREMRTKPEEFWNQFSDFLHLSHDLKEAYLDQRPMRPLAVAGFVIGLLKSQLTNTPPDILTRLDEAVELLRASRREAIARKELDLALLRQMNFIPPLETS